jgi:hypothetical protein
MTTRKDIVKKLISEGFNRNTLIMMSDNELKTLCKTLFNESVMVKANAPTAAADIANAKKQGKTIETYEGKKDVYGMKNAQYINEDNLEVKKAAKELYTFLKNNGVTTTLGSNMGFGKKVGMKTPGQAEASIFYGETGNSEGQTVINISLRGMEDKVKEVESEFLKAFPNLKIVSGTKKSYPIMSGTMTNPGPPIPGAVNKNFTVKEKTTAKGGLVSNTHQNAKHKTKNVKGKKENTEITEWVLSLAESKFTKFTSKKDIMGIINEKVMETSKPMPRKAKIGHNGVPEFMTYDSIVGNNPSTAPSPSQPEVSPDAPPREKPNKPKTPYQPGPGTNPKPKALAEKKKIK